MGDGTKDNVKDKFAKRFEDDDSDSAETRATGETDTTTAKDSDSQTVKTAKTVNIKSEWTNHSVYLPDHLADDLTSQYKRLDWQLDDEFDLDLQKTRHYYPLIVALGLEQLDKLESKEIKDKLEVFNIK